MDVLKLSFLCLLFPLLCRAANTCPQPLCGTNDVVVRFPFQFNDRLGGGNSCGYPGFNLSCNDQKQVVLNLPNSGNFYVRNIDYRAQVVQLYDPSGCLWGRLLNMNLSGSPFETSDTRIYTYVTCPFHGTLGLPPRIHCLSNFSTWTTATTSTSFVRELTNKNDCHIIAVVQVPVVQLVQYDKGNSSALSEDLYLAWNKPDCKKCEATQGTCAFVNSSEQDSVCSYGTGGLGKVADLLLYLALLLGLPVIIFIIICCVCVIGRIQANRDNRQQNSTLAVTATPAETLPVTLGESKVHT